MTKCKKLFLSSTVLLFLLSSAYVALVTAEPSLVVWNQTYGGTGREKANALVETSDGGYAIAGLAETDTFGVDQDVWLVKTDANGNMEWNKTYGGVTYSGAIDRRLEDNRAYSLVETSDGGYALACDVNYDVVVPDAGWSDVWLIKTDKNGNMEWNQTYGGTKFEQVSSLVETADGGFALAGDQRLSYYAHNYDILLIKTDAHGVTQEFENVETVKPEEPKTIVVPDDYPTIKEAIDNAAAGDTVFVKKGTYHEGSQVTIDKPLSLIGEDPQSTVINGGYDKRYPKNWDWITIQVSAPDVTISGFTITNCEIALSISTDVYLPDTTRIIGNNIANNTDSGVRVDSASNILISENNITNSYRGVTIGSSLNCTVSGNNITETSQGIEIGGSINVTVKENNILRNTHGLNLEWCGPYYVYANNITDNQESGIQFGRQCINASIYQNNIIRNSIGVELQNYRIFRAENIFGSGNTFHQNNFVENSQQVFVDPDSEVYENDLVIRNGADIVSWSKNGEGNYWSNYNGTDNNGDGIGDTPYVIDENNQDNYPLMNPADKVIAEVPLWIPLLIILLTLIVIAVIYRYKLHVKPKNQQKHVKPETRT